MPIIAFDFIDLFYKIVYIFSVQFGELLQLQNIQPLFTNFDAGHIRLRTLQLLGDICRKLASSRAFRSSPTKSPYATRKSTDTEDRQVRSISDQLAELKELAVKEQIEVVDIFVEKQTAKAPGRPVFNEMLLRIEANEANGILAWHPDRLARNSVDGGKIIYLLDARKIAELKFPTFWCDPTPQGEIIGF